MSYLKKIYGPYKNIQCIQAGIWNKNEKLSIANPEGGAAEFMFKNNSPDNNAINGITVSSILDSQNWDEVDILKLDIEGAEKEVFSAR